LKYNRIFNFAPASGRQIFRQPHRPVAHAQEAVYASADRFEKSPHFAVAALAQHNPVPLIAAGAFPIVAFLDGDESSDTIL
jgi:hypothetical protein